MQMWITGFSESNGIQDGKHSITQFLGLREYLPGTNFTEEWLLHKWQHLPSENQCCRKVCQVSQDWGGYDMSWLTKHAMISNKKATLYFDWLESLSTVTICTWVYSQKVLNSMLDLLFFRLSLPGLFLAKRYAFLLYV